MTQPMKCPDPYEIVAAALRCQRESLTPESGMYRTHGWDSFGHVTIIGALENALGISIPNDQILNLTTMRAILERYQVSGND